MKTYPALLTLIATLALAACGSGPDYSHDEDAAHGDAHGAVAEEFERGPHRGRLLRDGDFAVEVTIFETGVPPEFHVYAYSGDKALAPQDVAVTIELHRLGGATDRFTFQPQDDYLKGSGTVVEPHSFDVSVVAEHGGKQHRWQYASYEGRTTIPATVAAASGLTVATAGPATIRESLHLMGRVTLNHDRYATVKARFPGPVQSVAVALGDTVRAGQTLAVVENADSLRSYSVTSPIAGVVLARHTNVGDVAGTEPLFEIADLGEVWLELHAFGADASRLRAGQPVRIERGDEQAPLETKIARVLPLASAASQTVIARASLPNADGAWRPGMAVNAGVVVASREVPLAVRTAGLQRFRDFTVVFAQVGDTYEVRMLDLGQRDGEWTEVLGGIEPGTPYVVEQSFLVKADIEKSGASHDH